MQTKRDHESDKTEVGVTEKRR